MKFFPCLGLLALLCGCSATSAVSETLTQARSGFKTTVIPSKDPKQPADAAPPGVFAMVKYPSAVGDLPAYLTPDPKDGKKHPAIIWITGGDCNSIGDVWTPASVGNDQTAAAYRLAGIVMMFPSLRGGNDNPGIKEGFLGEVDDVLAAEKWLETQPYVDTTRIYLGGHSTGGTLALLTAEMSTRFRDVFSFGAVGDVSGYGADSGFLPFDLTNHQEVELRSPGYWLDSIKSPLWAFEGTRGNFSSLDAMSHESRNPNAHFLAIQGATHFSVLAPTNRLIAQKIVADTGATTNISFTEDELNQNFAKK